mgnify:CR=1 FL=1
MIKTLPISAMPNWLAALEAASFGSTPLPLRDLLADSLYYPASGLDGDPVRRLAGNAHSFIYVDHGATDRAGLLAELTRPHCFNGYELLAARPVSQDELAPHGWTPMLPSAEDGKPTRFKFKMKTPFAVWAILRRLEDVDTRNDLPERFGFLYICGAGIATFQVLYV